jgi:hypothetical protein
VTYCGSGFKDSEIRGGIYIRPLAAIALGWLAIAGTVRSGSYSILVNRMSDVDGLIDHLAERHPEWQGLCDSCGLSSSASPSSRAFHLSCITAASTTVGSSWCRMT